MILINAYTHSDTSGLRSFSSSVELSFPLIWSINVSDHHSCSYTIDNFNNLGSPGFHEKRCQLLMHSMNMPPSVGFMLLSIRQYLEELFGYIMSSAFNYTMWFPIRIVVLETGVANLYQDTRVPILHKHLHKNFKHISIWTTLSIKTRT